MCIPLHNIEFQSLYSIFCTDDFPGNGSSIFSSPKGCISTIVSLLAHQSPSGRSFVTGAMCLLEAAGREAATASLTIWLPRAIHRPSSHQNFLHKRCALAHNLKTLHPLPSYLEAEFWASRASCRLAGLLHPYSRFPLHVFPLAYEPDPIFRTSLAFLFSHVTHDAAQPSPERAHCSGRALRTAPRTVCSSSFASPVHRRHGCLRVARRRG
jgi:hypothetical protein